MVDVILFNPNYLFSPNIDMIFIYLMKEKIKQMMHF